MSTSNVYLCINKRRVFLLLVSSIVYGHRSHTKRGKGNEEGDVRRQECGKRSGVTGPEGQISRVQTL